MGPSPSASTVAALNKLALGRGQPVRLLVRARRLVLNVDSDRAVLIFLQLVPLADGVAVKRVCHEGVVPVVRGE
jgi:hypothetical protein